jgi:hypothetical protein
MTDIVERLRRVTGPKEVTALACEVADEIEQLREAARPFAEHDWYDAELEDNNCQLTRHSGPVTVGHWRALRTALGVKL